jgi:hypothetical protein
MREKKMPMPKFTVVGPTILLDREPVATLIYGLAPTVLDNVLLGLDNLSFNPEEIRKAMREEVKDEVREESRIEVEETETNATEKERVRCAEIARKVDEQYGVEGHHCPHCTDGQQAARNIGLMIRSGEEQDDDDNA